MKNIIFILLFSMQFVFGQQLPNWPVTTTPAIGGNYGSLEYSFGASWLWHDAIDIAGSSSTDVVALRSGEVIDIWDDHGKCIAIKLDDYPNVHFVYAHCSNVSVQLFQWINAGTVIGKIADASIYGTIYDHLHFKYVDGSAYMAVNQSVNPLDKPEFSNFKDPVASPGGDSEPQFGPLFIKQNGTSTYLNPANNYIYGQVNIIREITDNMGFVLSNPLTLSAPISWSVQNTRFNGIKAIPYKIAFSIKNNLSQQIIWPEKSITFTGNPKDDIFMNKLYEDDLKTIPPAGQAYWNYCFNLTNITANNVVQNNFWNTTDFSDGSYSLIFKAEDRNPDNNVSDPVTVLVDNYGPYIKMVEITSSSILIYKGMWTGSYSTGINFQQSPSTLGMADGSTDVVIKITASEPMSALTVDAAQLPPSSTTFNADKTIWTFTLNSIELTSYLATHPNGDGNIINEKSITLFVSGKDLAQNNLLNINSTQANLSSNELPVRNSNGVFSPLVPSGSQITDTRHKFLIGCGSDHKKSGNTCLMADFIVNHQNTVNNVTLNFTDLSIGNPNYWEWDFGDGTIIAGTGQNYQNPSHSYYYDFGLYGGSVSFTVKLKIIRYIDNSFDVETKESYIILYSPNGNSSNVELLPVVDFTATSPTIITSGTTVSFQDLSIVPDCEYWDGTAAYYIWDFGDNIGAINTTELVHPEHIYNTAGVYTVYHKICTQCGCPFKSKVGYIIVTDDLSDDIVCNSWPIDPLESEPVTLNGYIILDDYSVLNNYTYTFNYGDNITQPISINSTSTFESLTPHTYSIPGEYQPTLRVTANGITQTTLCDKVTVRPVYTPPSCSIVYDSPLYYTSGSNYTHFKAEISGGSEPLYYVWKHYFPGEINSDDIKVDAEVNFLLTSIIGEHKIEFWYSDSESGSCYETEFINIEEMPTGYDYRCIKAKICPSYEEITTTQISTGTRVDFYNVNSEFITPACNECFNFQNANPTVQVDRILWYLYEIIQLSSGPYYNVIDSGSDFYTYSHIFNTPGKYFVSLMAWSHFEGEIWPDVGPLADDADSPIFEVINCGPSILNVPPYSTINRAQTININGGTNGLSISSSATFTASNSINVENTIIELGNDVVLQIEPCAGNVDFGCLHTVLINNENQNNQGTIEANNINKIINQDQILQSTEIKLKDINKEQYFYATPNLFSDVTSLNFNVMKKEFINISLYQIGGSKIKTVVNDIMKEGEYKIIMELPEITEGFYICVFKTEHVIKTIKLIKSK